MARFCSPVDAGRVDQQQLAFGKSRDAQQAMARGLRSWRDDADLGPDQGIDQGGFADIGTADNGDLAGAMRGIVMWGLSARGCVRANVCAGVIAHLVRWRELSACAQLPQGRFRCNLLGGAA